MENIMVIAAHPDDELLGAGGTIRRRVNEGKTARALILAEGLTSRKDKRSDTGGEELAKLQNDARRAAEEAGYTDIDFCGFADNRMDGTDLLDIIKTISFYISQYQPDTIFTHHHGDLNIDHRLTCEAVLTACRPAVGSSVRRIYAFEIPSSTEWNYNYQEPFKPNVYFDVTDTMEAKLKGMACYRTENTVYPHPRSAQALMALGQYRGSSAGMELAEGFMLLRELI